MDRRTFLQSAAAGAAALAFSQNSLAEQTNSGVPGSNPDFTAIQKEIEKRHDESVQRLQQWIRQPSIAAEKRGMDEGCDLIMRMLRDAGFGEVTKVSTDGQPGISATLDAGAPRSIGMYFMYDVKQADGFASTCAAVGSAKLALGSGQKMIDFVFHRPERKPARRLT